MFHIENSDSCIWNEKHLINWLTEQVLHNAHDIVCSTNGEGPCADSLGLYAIFDWICSKYNFQKNKITLETCNLKESHSDYNIIIAPQMKYLHATRKITGLQNKKHFGNSFKIFGNFVGHGNINRLHLGSFLHTNKISCLQTYHTKTSDDYHRPFIGLEDMMLDHLEHDKVENALTFLSHCPLTLDKIDEYPILCPQTLNITKVYPDFFIELVNLTYFTGNTFYLDEKIWRPIQLKTPFIVQGPQWFLQNLKRLGFRTFYDYWDEGYSEDPTNIQVLAICDIITELSTLTTQQLKDMYVDMQPILEHNYQLMQTLTTKDFHNEFR